MNTLPQTPRLLAVTDGHTTIGYLVVRDKVGIEALDAVERSTGTFSTIKLAADAVSARTAL
jgi:hypothetical protein